MTSANSQSTLFNKHAGPLTWCAGAYHASQVQSPASGSGPKTTVGCGRSSCGSCEESDPVGSLLRTSLGSSLLAMNPKLCSVTWSKRATRFGRSLWALTTLEHRIGESGCGLWPTADANSGERGGQPDLEHQREHGRTVTINDVVKHWCTPNAMAGGSISRGGDDLIDEPLLAGQVKQHAWPAATSRDHRSIHASPATLDRNARPLSEVVGQHDPASDSTNGKCRGSLNSRWTATLMGFPSDWLDLATETLSRLSAMPSSRRASKPLAEPSCKSDE